MCIDGTAKKVEETDDSFDPGIFNQDPELLETNLRNTFKEIKVVNVSLLKNKIPCIILSIEKNRIGHIKGLHEQVCALHGLQGIKMILYVEHTVDANDLPTALWRFCNNLDPKRDFHLYKRHLNNRYTACMGLDGTRKTKEFDNFQRDWPNIIVADDATIKSVDEKWNELGIGQFIPSPSLKFKDQMYGEEAIVN